MGRPAIDLTGQKFGRLKVLSQYRGGPSNLAYWNCQCDCGSVRHIRGQRLRNGTTTSCGCYMKVARILPDSRSVLNKLYNGYRRNAYVKPVPFEIAIEEFERLVRGNCFYCGRAPYKEKFCKKTGGLKAHGVDRVDNERGYVNGNCVTCCSDCNYAKGERKLEDFLSWIRTVYEYQRLGGGDATNE